MRGQRSPERDAAIKAGQSQYFTGVPCVNGHVANRHVIGGICIGCSGANRVRYQSDPEYRAKRKAQNKIYWANRRARLLGILGEGT